MKNSLQFSFFYDEKKGVYNTQPLSEINFSQLVKIYTSARLEAATVNLQNAPKEERDALKKFLPYITPHGTFTQRGNDYLKFGNDWLIALDIDGIKGYELTEVLDALKRSRSTLLVAVSPKMQGVKALILVSDRIAPTERYKLLSDKQNKYILARMLNIQKYVDNIDDNQAKLSQPLFLAFDANLYVNENAEPLNIKFTPPPPPIEPKKAEYKTAPIEAQTKIEHYIKTATNNLCSHLAGLGVGERHKAIIKVNYIAGVLHYAPSITTEVESMLLAAVIHSYGNEKTAISCGAIRSFKAAFNTSQTLFNNSIEEIIAKEESKKTTNALSPATI